MPTIEPAGRWDWFRVPLEIGKRIAHAPGVVYHKGDFQVPRNALPLLRTATPELASEIDKHLAPAYPIDWGVLEQRHGVALRPWQRTALDFIEPRRGVLLADEMRLGKTLTALLAHEPSSGPLVVLGPLDTRAVWLGWFTKLWPDVTPYVIEGKKIDVDRLTSSPIVFGHYDVMASHQATGLRPGTLVVDEIHLLSNPQTKRTQAVQFIASGATRVIGLSGTPLWNMSTRLWSVMATVNPAGWGRPFGFAQRYCGPEVTEHGWKYHGITNIDEWRARRDEVVLGRTWAQVRPDLPPPTREMIEVPLDGEAYDLVDQMAAELMSGSTNLIDITILARYRQAIGRFKAKIAVELATAMREPVVVWCWHKAIVKEIADAIGARAYVMTGDQTGLRRAKVIEAWNADLEGVLILTLPVGQVGIDLSHASEAIFVEPDWTPAVLSQAEMRTFSPSRPMRIRYLVLAHAIDKLLLDTVVRKVDRGRGVGMPAAGSTFGELVEADDAGDLLRELGELLLG